MVHTDTDTHTHTYTHTTHARTYTHSRNAQTVEGEGISTVVVVSMGAVIVQETVDQCVLELSAVGQAVGGDGFGRKRAPVLRKEICKMTNTRNLWWAMPC
jgi:hypothetical protein